MRLPRVPSDMSMVLLLKPLLSTTVGLPLWFKALFSTYPRLHLNDSRLAMVREGDRCDRASMALGQGQMSTSSFAGIRNNVWPFLPKGDPLLLAGAQQGMRK